MGHLPVERSGEPLLALHIPRQGTAPKQPQPRSRHQHSTERRRKPMQYRNPHTSQTPSHKTLLRLGRWGRGAGSVLCGEVVQLFFGVGSLRGLVEEILHRFKSLCKVFQKTLCKASHISRSTNYKNSLVVCFCFRMVQNGYRGTCGSTSARITCSLFLFPRADGKAIRRAEEQGV